MKKITVQPRILILVFIVLAILMVSSALIELYQSKIELLTLMADQGQSLLESLIIASDNALSLSDGLEESYQERLLNNACLIKKLYEEHGISNSHLHEISVQNKIDRISILNNEGNQLFTSHPDLDSGLPPTIDPYELFYPIFDDEEDTLIIGMRPTGIQGGFRYILALAAYQRYAIVLIVNAQELIHLRKTTGFGALLRKVVQNPGIIFAVLQDTSSVIAAAGRVGDLESLQESPFLTRAYSDSIYMTRILKFDSLQVFEAVHTFSHQNHVIGLFRLGLSLEPVQAINARIYRRLIIITIVLIIIGFIILTFILIRQRYDLLQKRFKEVETFSSNIIQKVSDAIIVLDDEKKIKIMNHAAEILFGRKENELLGFSINLLFPGLQGEMISSDPSTMQQINCIINQHSRYLLLSKTPLTDQEAHEITILVIRDLTAQKRLEDQIQRKERLSAMGQLASGVAHEIRNPLNTIGTIVQQLDKDFEPVQQGTEYHQLAGLVYKEVRRINDSIEKFLKFSRPEPIHPVPFILTDLLKQLQQQYRSMLEAQQINFELEVKWDGVVHWDPQQIKQVLMNLIQNAADAIGENGSIHLSVTASEQREIILTVKDNGPGIADSIKSKIFNLYFTTKAKGTGIGLSIVQRIILEHNGIISVESQPGQGSAFILRIPVQFAGLS